MHDGLQQACAPVYDVRFATEALRTGSRLFWIEEIKHSSGKITLLGGGGEGGWRRTCRGENVLSFEPRGLLRGVGSLAQPRRCWQRCVCYHSLPRWRCYRGFKSIWSAGWKLGPVFHGKTDDSGTIVGTLLVASSCVTSSLGPHRLSF
jgi:hypothetical protein